MHTKQLWVPLMGMLLCGEIARGADWQVVAQPDLKEQLAKAPELELETLAAPARGVTTPWLSRAISSTGAAIPAVPLTNSIRRVHGRS